MLFFSNSAQSQVRPISRGLRIDYRLKYSESFKSNDRREGKILFVLSPFFLRDSREHYLLDSDDKKKFLKVHSWLSQSRVATGYSLKRYMLKVTLISRTQIVLQKNTQPFGYIKQHLIHLQSV